MSGTFDFPANPIVGDIYTTPNGMSYEWTGKTWDQTGTSLSFGIGLKQTGLVVDLIPPIAHDAASGTTAELGGVLGIKRDGGQALNIDGGGYASVLPATDTLLGGMRDPPPDDKIYSRRRTAIGLGEWVEIAAAETIEAGIGLDFNATNTNVIDLQPPKFDPVGGTPQMIGGVVVGKRDETQGLDLNLLGLLSAPAATDTLAGSIVEPPPDDIAYSRTRSVAGISSWKPNPAVLNHRIGLDDTTTPGVVDLLAATETEIGGLTEPRQGPSGITYTRSTGAWVVLPPTALPTDYGIGLTLSPGADPGDNQIVNLTPAGLTPALLGGVWVPPRGELQGLEINNPNQPGMLTSPPASDTMAGVIVEPPVGPGQLWARSTSAPGPGKWEPVFNIGTLTYKGAWKPATNDPNITAVAGKLAGDFWVVDCVDLLVAETPPLGSTPGLDGVMMKEGDWVIWNEVAQVWNHINRQSAQWGIGLEQTGLVVDLQPATAMGELGGVKVPVRGPGQGLDLEPDGTLRAPLATDQHAGTMTEPTATDTTHVRMRDSVTGLSKWVPTAAAIEAGVGLEFNATTPNVLDLQPPKFDPLSGMPQVIGGVVVGKRDNAQGLELNVLGGLSAPAATDTLAGTIVEPPPDDVQYARTRSASGNSRWSPVALAKPAGHTEPEIGVVFVPARTIGQGLALAADGGLRAPLATDQHAGTITEPPEPTKHYLRTRDAVTGIASWVEAEDVTIAVEPPLNPTHGQLWWDNDQGGLYVFYRDPTDVAPEGQWVQINGSGGGAAVSATYGDVKSGFQPGDHAGWIKLDGRAITTLTAGQQATATALGFTTNLPNASGSVLMQNGGAMGAISGSMSKTIAVANLPAHNMTAASAGAHTHVTDSQGGHNHVGNSSHEMTINTSSTIYSVDEGVYHTLGAHTHTAQSAGAHTHTVALGGSGTALNVTPQSLSVSYYVFLGP